MKEMSSQQRKEHPVARGVLAYFPDAILEVAHCSFVGNEQHHPGEPLHWDKSKSTDEADACIRHLMDDIIEPGVFDNDGVRHAAKAAWRALANLQRRIEEEDEDIIVNVHDQLPAFDHGNVGMDDKSWEEREQALADHLIRRAMDAGQLMTPMPIR